jgi:hypothetical protein
MKYLKYMTIILALAAIWACGGGDDSGDEPSISKDNIDVQTSVNLLGDGHTLEISVKANCSWTITWDADWLSVNPQSGHGTQQISITAGMNTTGSQRVAVLRVQGGSAPMRTVTVTQAKGSDAEPTNPTDPTDPTEPTNPENPDTEKEPTADDNLPPS